MVWAQKWLADCKTALEEADKQLTKAKSRYFTTFPQQAAKRKASGVVEGGEGEADDMELALSCGSIMQTSFCLQ